MPIKQGGIYQILNTINGHRYIGSAVSLPQRWAQHRLGLRHGKHDNAHLQNAWNLHGGGAFVCVVLEYVLDLERLLEREQYYMDTLHPEYNIAPVAGSSLGRNHTEEARRNMSEARKGKALGPQSEEHKRKNGAAQKGKAHGPMSEETKGKLNAAMRGENGSNVKLTEQAVTEIKTLLAEGVLLQREIAAMYGVSQGTISAIKRGRSWAHLSGEGGERRECAG